MKNKGFKKPINGAKAAAAVGIISFGLCIGESLWGNANASGSSPDTPGISANEITAIVGLNQSNDLVQTQQNTNTSTIDTSNEEKTNNAIPESNVKDSIPDNVPDGETENGDNISDEADSITVNDGNNDETDSVTENDGTGDEADGVAENDGNVDETADVAGNAGFDDEKGSITGDDGKVDEADDITDEGNIDNSETYNEIIESSVSGFISNIENTKFISSLKPDDLMDMYPGYTAEMDNERYRLITGMDKQTFTVGNMPAGYRSDAEASKKMKNVTFNVWKLRDDLTRYSSKMSIYINAELADEVQSIFEDIYELDIQFPIKSLVGYKYRKVGGVGLVGVNLMSVHSFGCAIDINPGDYDNDYFLGKGNDLRNKDNPYCIPDEVIEIFENHGWFWGGNFDIAADTMHFQFFGLDFLQYENPEEPFPVLSQENWKNEYDAFVNMEQRLVKLGYLKKVYKSFNDKVDGAVRKFQEDQGLETTGVVNYDTWEPLINLTHDMNYVF